jgi:hypothetical protein
MMGPPARLFHIRKKRIAMRMPRTIRTIFAVLLIIFSQGIEL